MPRRLAVRTRVRVTCVPVLPPPSAAGVLPSRAGVTAALAPGARLGGRLLRRRRLCGRRLRRAQGAARAQRARRPEVDRRETAGEIVAVTAERPGGAERTQRTGGPEVRNPREEPLIHAAGQSRKRQRGPAGRARCCGTRLGDRSGGGERARNPCDRGQMFQCWSHGSSTMPRDRASAGLNVGRVLTCPVRRRVAGRAWDCLVDPATPPVVCDESPHSR
jgi:hypothetical protein